MAFPKILSCILLFVTAFGAPVSQHAAAVSHWVDIWTSMPQLTEKSNLPPAPYLGANSVFVNTTIRQTIHVSHAADTVRLRISNAFGPVDLSITAVTIALPTGGQAGVSSVQSDSVQSLTFGGLSSFIIPQSALAVSDPIGFSVEDQSMVTVTIYLEAGQQGTSITSHPGSRTTTYMSMGNLVDADDIADSTTASVAHWYFISALEAVEDAAVESFIIVGDSITDGRGSTDNANNRWPDLLLARLHNSSETSDISVVNQAAGGNCILHDGLGPNALSRLDRDVFAHSNVAWTMIFEGINDITGIADDATAQAAEEDRLVWAYKQFADRAHDRGLSAFIATITPWKSSLAGTSWTAAREVTRESINSWIRSQTVFDAYADFDAIVRDPNDQQKLLSAYDSGDGLHPNVAGYQAIADSFPVEEFFS